MVQHASEAAHRLCWGSPSFKRFSKDLILPASLAVKAFHTDRAFLRTWIPTSQYDLSTNRVHIESLNFLKLVVNIYGASFSSSRKVTGDPDTNRTGCRWLLLGFSSHTFLFSLSLPFVPSRHVLPCSSASKTRHEQAKPTLSKASTSSSSPSPWTVETKMVTKVRMTMDHWENT